MICFGYPKLTFILNGPVIFSYAQRRKQTVYYLSVNIWVLAPGQCLLLLQSA